MLCGLQENSILIQNIFYEQYIEGHSSNCCNKSQVF